MPVDVAASELIRRCRAGEEAARAELFTRYRQYLRLLAEAQLGRHLRGKCDPSDLVQQTLLEAHRDFPAFQGTHETELLAWLRRILAHNLFNEARHFATRGRDAPHVPGWSQMPLSPFNLYFLAGAVTYYLRDRGRALRPWAPLLLPPLLVGPYVGYNYAVVYPTQALGFALLVWCG